MLLNFTFKNYASFRDVQQFSMEIPSKENGEQWKYPELSTVTALYGANASGKSSFWPRSGLSLHLLGMDMHRVLAKV